MNIRIRYDGDAITIEASITIVVLAREMEEPDKRERILQHEIDRMHLMLTSEDDEDVFRWLTDRQ